MVSEKNIKENNIVFLTTLRIYQDLNNLCVAIIIFITGSLKRDSFLIHKVNGLGCCHHATLQLKWMLLHTITC